MVLEKGCKGCQHRDVKENEYPCNQCFPVMSGYEGIYSDEYEAKVEFEKEIENVDGN